MELATQEASLTRKESPSVMLVGPRAGMFGRPMLHLLLKKSNGRMGTHRSDRCANAEAYVSYVIHSIQKKGMDVIILTK